MNDAAMSLATKMDALKHNYLVQIEPKIEALKSFVRICENGLPSTDLVVKTCELAHKLSGSGATYGFSAISDTAQVLEDILSTRPLVTHSVMETKAKLLLEACENAHGALPLEPVLAIKDSPDAMLDDQALASILLVDDDEAMGQLLPHVFQDEANVTVIKNAQEALAYLENEVPNLVLLDDKMPGLGGIGFLEELNARQVTHDFPIFMLTASRKNTDVVLAYKFGVADYITKPFDPNELRARVMEYIKNTRRKVLVADDDLPIRNILAAKLRARGFQTIFAEDSRTAYSKTITEKPDLVLLDRMLPDEDGLSVFLRLKKELGDEMPIVVFLTAKRRQTDILEALKNGGNDYVIKPFKVEDVVARCAQHLTKKPKKLS